jgi:predicted ATPase/DNA-binding winged helix-turn-helix (wHTH) protein
MKQFESFHIDVQNECLWRDGEQIALPPRSFAVLRYLVENPGRLISHDELLDKLWPDTFVQPQILRTYMLELRKVLGDDARQPRFIRSHPKRGYVFVAAVQERGPESFLASSHANSAPLAGNHEAVHVPVSSGSNPAGSLIGREKELNALNAHLARLADSTRQVVLLSGEPGLGKTALVDTFCAAFYAQWTGAMARGQCVQGIGAREQHYPVMEALAQLCASSDGERACGVLARIAPEWLPAPARDHSNQASHSRSTSDLCAALEELAAEKPLLLVLEDIHWADEPTLEAISALARRRAPAQLMILASFSPHHMGPDHPLRALRQDLRMRRLSEEIALEPLRRQHVAALLRKRLGQEELPQGLDAFLHEHSEGNPLFLFAILDHLIAERFLVRAGLNGEARWEQRAPFQQMEAGIPDELVQMIELEIGRLAPAEQRLLEAASLIDVAFPAWAVAAALKEEIAETEEAFDNLARLVPFIHRAGHDELPDGSRSAFYAFAHRLYRDVLYQRQSAAQRARRHTRVADRLSRLFAGREASVAHEMAVHLEAAGLWRRAIEVLQMAVLQMAATAAPKQDSRIFSEDLLRRALRIAENLPAPERESVELDLRKALDGCDNDASTAKKRKPKHLTKA